MKPPIKVLSVFLIVGLASLSAQSKWMTAFTKDFALIAQTYPGEFTNQTVKVILPNVPAHPVALEFIGTTGQVFITDTEIIYIPVVRGIVGKPTIGLQQKRKIGYIEKIEMGYRQGRPKDMFGVYVTFNDTKVWFLSAGFACQPIDDGGTPSIASGSFGEGYDQATNNAPLIAKILEDSLAAIKEEKAEKKALRQAAAKGAPTPTTKDAATRLKELQKLKDDGLISEEEYTAKKTEILKQL